MVRLINADELLETLRKSCKWHAQNSRELSLLQRDILIVQRQPAVEAEPVKHGRWIYDFNEDGYDGYRCSNCMEHRQIDYKDDYHYCPNCGGKNGR